jgi:uncharacterized protein YegL
LHFFWILDRSGSMRGGKIQSLNAAIRDALPHIRLAAAGNPSVQVHMRTVVFSDGAKWLSPESTPISRFEWTDIDASGHSDLGAALSLVAEACRIPPMNRHDSAPTIVLVSDGLASDDFEKGLLNLMTTPWGQRAVRIAIAIGRDADRELLRRFIGKPTVAGQPREPLQADSGEALVAYMRWLSSSVADERMSGEIPVLKRPKSDSGAWIPWSETGG